jgi:hypothetical protein
MTEYDQKLADVLLDSLCLEWQNNGNISAEAVRDTCIQTLADITNRSFDQIVVVIEQQTHTTH